MPSGRAIRWAGRGFYQEEYAQGGWWPLGPICRTRRRGCGRIGRGCRWGWRWRRWERYEDALAAFGAFGRILRSGEHGRRGKSGRWPLAGLREGQSRRSLAAKAWIKCGDMLKALERYEEALAAYKKVRPGLSAGAAPCRAGVGAAGPVGPDRARGGCWLGGVSLCGRAGPGGRPSGARMQAGLMSLLFDEGRYEEALAAHRFYLTAYRGVCGRGRGCRLTRPCSAKPSVCG